MACNQTFRILHTESSTGLGGQELRILSEAKGMMARGHQVVIAAPSTSPLAKFASNEGIPYEIIPVGFDGWRRLVPLFLGCITRHHIQVVHTHGSQDSWTASLAGRFSKEKPVIVRARHKSTPISRTFRHGVLYRYLPHAVVTTGEFVRQQCIRDNRLSPDTVFSIPTGVDLQRFRPGLPSATLRGALGIAENAPVVGTVTFLRHEKGSHILIEAVGLLRKAFPRLRCLIVGTGPEYPNLLDLIRQRRLDSMIVFPGLRNDIPALLSLLNVFVLPSLEEGMPQSLTQALAMECPVVASDVGAVPEVIQEGQTGLLVPARNPQVLAEKVAFLLSHPEQGKQMGQTGRKMIEQGYSIEKMLDQTEQLYAQLWEKRTSRAA
ncbi:MAG: glycosyltransferase family 4 protein [Nitrospirales bacterium]